MSVLVRRGRQTRLTGSLSTSEDTEVISKPGSWTSADAELAATLIWDFPASRIVKNKSLRLKPASLGCFAKAAQADKDNAHDQQKI